MPELTGQASDFLSNLFQNPGNIFSQFGSPGGNQQANLLQQQLGNAFQRTLQANPQGNTFANQFQQAFGTGSPRMPGAIDIPEMGGAGVIAAAQPIFQRNLEQAIQAQREFGGPRFASESGRQARQLSQEALQDFNLFQKQTLESGLNRQLGAAQLGVQQQLGRGAQALQGRQIAQQGFLGSMGLDLQGRGLDIQQQQNLGSLFQGQQQLGIQNLAQRLGFLLPLLQGGLQAGGAFSGPVITESPGWFQQFTDFLGTAGGTAVGLGA